MNSSVESQKFFGLCGSFGLQGADRSITFSFKCNGAPRRSHKLDARGSLRDSSCPWVWSSHAVSLCPSCCLQNVRFPGKTPLLMGPDTSMFTPAHRPRFSFERAGQSRPRERVKGSILRKGHLRHVGQFTLGMQKLLVTLPTCFSAVKERQFPIVEIEYPCVSWLCWQMQVCTVGT